MVLAAGGNKTSSLMAQMESRDMLPQNGSRTEGASDAVDRLSAEVGGTEGGTRITTIEQGENGAVRKAVKVSPSGTFRGPAGIASLSDSWVFDSEVDLKGLRDWRVDTTAYIGRL